MILNTDAIKSFFGVAPTPAPAPAPAPTGAPAPAPEGNGNPAPSPAPAPVGAPAPTSPPVDLNAINAWFAQKPPELTAEQKAAAAAAAPVDPLDVSLENLSKQIENANFVGQMTAEEIAALQSDPAKLVAKMNEIAKASFAAATAGTANLAKKSIDARMTAMAASQQGEIQKTLAMNTITAGVNSVPQMQGALMAPVRDQLIQRIYQTNPAASQAEVSAIVSDYIVKQLGVQLNPSGMNSPKPEVKALNASELAGLSF